MISRDQSPPAPALARPVGPLVAYSLEAASGSRRVRSRAACSSLTGPPAASLELTP